MADEQEQGQQPDFAGYPSLDELKKGYRESGTEAKKQRERAERAESAYQAALAQANPRQDVPSRNTAGQRLTEYGIPVDALDEYVEQKVQSRLEERFQPIMRGLSARQEMVGKYKDYNKFESDMMEYVNSDPQLQQTYNRVFTADPVAAFEYAYLKYGHTKRGESRNGVSEEEKSEAQIPSQRSGDTRRTPQADVDVQRLLEVYQQNPTRRNAEAYAKARLHGVIKEDFLRQ